MTTSSNKNGAELSKLSDVEYNCNLCNYKCCKKFNFNRHLLSTKHLKLLELNKTATKNEQKRAEISCENCNQEYKDRTGLWRHKKICINNYNHVINENVVDKKDVLIEYLIKENKEIKELILELAKKDTYNNSNNTINSHNKSFNLNFFLNETCKDAMNIMEFVDSIKLQLSDLENVGKIGYVEGISNIIVKNLNDLDVTERPIHCTDKKRETLYIKDEDKWEKEDEEKKKIKKVIKHVANKNIRLLQKFKEVHPDCGKSSSKFSDQYDKIIVESMGGSGDNDYEKEDKIIKKITKEVIIDKEIY